jgi:regulation of enolase protein 1 (concanavalin A-like superfamily)
MKHLGLFLFVITIFLNPCYSQSIQKCPEIASLPKKIVWINHPLDWNISGNTFTINAGKGSRLFIDPYKGVGANTAPMALFVPDSTFLFSCKVSSNLKNIFDAGVLVIYGSEEQWAKFCFEYSPQQKPMIVTVVNKRFSDDCNHVVVDGDYIYFRVAGMGNGAFAFHYSFDNKYWNLARYFNLNQKDVLKVGFLSQSPKGDSCRSVFSEIDYKIKKLENYRNGD